MSDDVRLWARVPASRHDVYSCLSDPEELVSIVDGLRELRALGHGRVEEGSQFAAIVRFGPKDLAQKLTVTKLVPDERVAWRSSDDGQRELSFTLRDGDEAGETRVLLVVSYRVPDGLKGAVLGPVVEQAVKSGARRTLVRLKERFGRS